MYNENDYITPGGQKVVSYLMMYNRLDAVLKTLFPSKEKHLIDLLYQEEFKFYELIKQYFQEDKINYINYAELEDHRSKLKRYLNIFYKEGCQK